MQKRDLTKKHNVTLYNSNGKVKYRGEVVNDQYDGWGVLYSKTGHHAGYWVQGKKNGYGEEVRKRPFTRDRTYETIGSEQITLKEERYAGNQMIFVMILSFMISTLCS